MVWETKGVNEGRSIIVSFDTAKKLAGLLNTSVVSFLGETENDNLLKDPKMMERLKEIGLFSNDEQQQILLHLIW